MTTYDYHNPATGEVLGQLEPRDQRSVSAAVATARTAFATWSKTPLRKRISHLKRGQRWLIDNIDNVAQVISTNNGKPRVESLMADVAPVIQTINYYADEAENILAPEKISIGRWLPTKVAYMSYSPLGVIGIISPWNYPFSIPMAEIVASLVAGNCVVNKPSEVTSLVNQEIQKFIEACGLPNGVFTMLEGDGLTGAALSSSKVDRIIFTGSVPTGIKVMKAAAENLVPVSLELGGKDPCLVFEDANIDVASSGVVVGGFYNNGQTCCSIERLLVQKSIEEKFIKAVQEKLKRLRVGPSLGYENDIGPITYVPQKKIIKSQLDALAGSSKNLYDGESAFLKPILVRTNEKDLIWNEETFGPVVCYDTFETEEEAIKKANTNSFGLASIVWSGSHTRAKRVAEQLYTGTVVINDAPFTNAIAALPWGGVKNSGIGRVHGEEGLKDLCLKRVVTYDRMGQIKQPWWFPYSQERYKFMKAFALFSGESSWFRKAPWLFRMIRNMISTGKRL